MDFAFNEEQDLLRETARRWFEEKSPSEKVRQVMDTDEGFDRAQWQEISQMGWPGLAIAEEYGGAGYGFVELAVLLEEMGRSLFPSPFLPSAVLAANAIAEAGTDDQRKRLLPGIASGETIATFALTEPNGRWDASGITLTATKDGDHHVLSGTKSFVPYGHVADLVIVAARTGTSDDPTEGVSLFAVPAAAAGLRRTRLETMDLTRPLAELVFEDVRVEPDALLGEAGAAWPAIEKVIDLASVALAAEAVGGAQRAMEMSVDYAKVRIQFGRPIGSFQAIKHKCADMLVQVESAKSAAYYAAWAAAEDPDELRIVAPLAKSYCSEAYFFCAAENIQVHGGIGFTWEHDAHLYFKRAKSIELMFGDPAWHRARLADRLGL